MKLIIDIYEHDYVFYKEQVSDGITNPLKICIANGKLLEDELQEIIAEIVQVANQEKFHDEKWALGLRYAVNIIDKYNAESEG